MALARLILSVILSTVCVLALGNACAGSSEPPVYETGDEWTYEITMNSDELTMTGIETFRMEGLKSEEVAGVIYDAYDMEFEGSLTISGSSEGVTFNGTATLSGRGSIEVETLDTIRSDNNISMEITAESDLFSVSYDIWEHSITTYSPPGGVGEEPENKTEGTSWVVTYTTHSDVMTCEDGSITTDYVSSTETRTYTYIGMENVTVPAGTFECEVVQVDDGDSIETIWYSDQVGYHVKSVREQGISEESTEVLQSYSYTPEEPEPETSEEPQDGLTQYLILGVAVAAAVIVAVVVMMLLKKRRGAPQAATPPPTPSPDSPAPPGQAASGDTPPGQPPR